MGFFGKFKNAAQDFGSAAIPFGVSAGLTALSGGTINPGTQMGLMALLGATGAGAKGFQGNEQQERLRKMQLAQQKATEEAQAANKLSAGRASLINALKPGAGARGTVTQAEQVQAPKAGLLETVAGGIGTGATVASQVMQAQNMLKDAAARRGLVEAQTANLEGMAADRTAAAAKLEGLETGADLFRQQRANPGLVGSQAAQIGGGGGIAPREPGGIRTALKTAGQEGSVNAPPKMVHPTAMRSMQQSVAKGEFDSLEDFLAASPEYGAMGENSRSLVRPVEVPTQFGNTIGVAGGELNRSIPPEGDGGSSLLGRIGGIRGDKIAPAEVSLPGANFTPQNATQRQGFDAAQGAAAQARTDAFDARLDRLGKIQNLQGPGAEPFDPGNVQNVAGSVGFNIAGDPSMSEADALRKITTGLTDSLGQGSVASLSPVAQQAFREQNKIISEERRSLINEFFDDAAAVADEQSAISAIDTFQTKLAFNPDLQVTEAQMNKALRTFASRAKSLDFQGEERKLLAGVMALDNSLERINERISDPQFSDTFGRLSGRITDLQASADKKSLTPDVMDLLTDIGFTSEMAVRIFSGAAVRDEEFERFRNDFIGSLSSGAENTQVSINAFRRGLRDRRDSIVQVARISEAGDLFTGISDQDLAKKALAGDYAARLTLTRRRGK